MKKIFIILMMLMVLMVFNINVYASDYKWSDFPNIPSQFSNDIYRVILYDPPYGDYKLFVSDEPFYNVNELRYICSDGFQRGKYYYMGYDDWSEYTYDTQQPYGYTDILLSTHDIYIKVGNTLTDNIYFYGDPVNTYAGDPGPTPTPYHNEPPDSWYQSILDWIVDSLGGIFEGLATPFQNIAQGINNIFQLFNPENQQNIFRILFVPRPEFIKANITALYGVIEEKIPLLNDLILILHGMAENLINAEVNTPPEFKITMPQKWGGFEAKIIDFNIYVPYRFFIMNIIRAIAWYFFIKRLLRRMPTIIY